MLLYLVMTHHAPANVTAQRKSIKETKNINGHTCRAIIIHETPEYISADAGNIQHVHYPPVI